MREKRSSFDEDLKFITTKTPIISVGQEIALHAGRISYENKEKKITNWGTADSIVPATARQHSAKVVTGDPHFKNLNETVKINRAQKD